MAVVPFPDPQQPPDRWEDDDSESGGKMSFLEHLDEFRKRLIKCIIAIVIGMSIAFFFLDRIWRFIMVPLTELIPEGGRLMYIAPSEAFLNNLKIALLSGLIIAAPAIMYQVWRFVAPGLYTNEKKFAIPFILLTSAGFIGGAAFSHYVVFPLMWRYFASFQNEFMVFNPQLSLVFSFYVRMILAMGLVFQMPSVVFFLARMGVVTTRFLVRNLKYAVLVNFVAAAVITPGGDPMAQTLIAGPMCVLYVLSIGIAWAFGKRRDPAEE